LNKKQIFVLAGALLIVVLLLIAPLTQESVPEQREGHDDHGIEAHMSDFRASLDQESREEVERLEGQLKQDLPKDEEISLLQSLISLFDKSASPVAAAFYAEQLALLEGTIERFTEAADRYFFAASYTQDHLRSHVYERAILAYERVLDKNPQQVDAKINLAVCYVESSGQPMKGIALLKEVLEGDSLNVKAHLNLGYFSVKSGQFDKAVERFEKVLEINPSYIEAYIYLGDVYEAKGEIEKAIEYYSLYAENVENPSLKAGAENYIRKLKSNH
jgi:tetratricopeptide (TPR) repeat protein